MSPADYADVHLLVIRFNEAIENAWNRVMFEMLPVDVIQHSDRCFGDFFFPHYYSFRRISASNGIMFPRLYFKGATIDEKLRSGIDDFAICHVFDDMYEDEPESVNLKTASVLYELK